MLTLINAIIADLLDPIYIHRLPLCTLHTVTSSSAVAVIVIVGHRRRRRCRRCRYRCHRSSHRRPPAAMRPTATRGVNACACSRNTFLSVPNASSTGRAIPYGFQARTHNGAENRGFQLAAGRPTACAMRAMII